MRSVIIGALVAFVVSLFITPLLIRFMRRKASQPIRELGIATHQVKQGTPTMGGIGFIVATVLAYGVGHVALLPLEGRPHLPTITGLVLVGLLVCGGFLGWLDDYLKVSKKNTGGLAGRWKLLGQLIIGVGFGTIALYFPSPEGYTVGSEYLSVVRDIDWLHIGKIASVLVFAAMVMGTSNAVNLTDGLDGLSSGSVAIAFLTYLAIAYWQYRHWCAEPGASTSTLSCYPVRDPLEVALVAGAVVGALVGFLWWNASPAKIFMGDVGSLGLGCLMAGMAISTHTIGLLPVIGALFVLITSSNIIQYVSFKTTGTRVFRMAPLHHHFEMAGWSETTIVIRFWLLAGVSGALGLGLFFADFLRSSGTAW
ncbi:phospho-N-acetylmuramoyl-pentapeptide-transferase [Actinorhabdospora filicis]|uniref:Phospho-N-acetylmuramoyl-pentapeptide-transferase n=1 Tax=Actinorhabdospora filicis TaxID=1785913 RepID=A0A9W6SPN6_9ACTN|nr:phospho-N-acetylmuramoyl-pentapeptide-transferase [Actinorhabdospora filicis]GLZ79906.1 phospho-N-acetylmuramoyl-pentapeptide-transferase [Actinorhabdospora filicis]